MTCCSLRLAMGEDLAYVAQQLGHADTSVTHRYYLRVMQWMIRRGRLQWPHRGVLTWKAGRNKPRGAADGTPRRAG